MSNKIFNSIITLMIVFILIIFSIYQVLLPTSKYFFDIFVYELQNRPYL
jgi:hypothetical protein